MNIVLFGFKGCGKSYFGQKLALALERPFIDTDLLIVERWNKGGGKEKTPSEIYRKIGERAFRDLETKTIASLNESSDSIIAVGGGAVINPENVMMLRKNGRMIFLDTSLATVLSRNIDTALGPLEKLYAERYPIYHSIAADKINIDALTENEVLRSLIVLAQQRTPTYGIK